MHGCWLLAIRYISYYYGRTTILVAALTLTFCLPLATRWTIERFAAGATARAAQTPLVIGAKGSPFGLVMHALYFRGDAPADVPWQQLERVKATGLARVIPLHVGFQAQGYPIIGSNAEYLRLRELMIQRGEPLERLGDCLLGANVARGLGLSPGDTLVSDPENLFDLSGPAPLRMRIRAILRPTGTADDDGVHCEVDTCWIMAGLGHGHQLAEPTDTTDQPQVEHAHAASRENLDQYTEVTAENLRTFHFHGRRDQYPLTALIALPKDTRAETLLLGQYLGPEEAYQAIRPSEIVAELLQMVAHVRRLMDLLVLVLALSTWTLFVLVILLSLKLRQRELRTLALLGTSRSKIATLVGFELGLVIMVSAGLGVLLAGSVAWSADWIIYWLITSDN